MSIPNRTTAADYHFHIYDYDGSQPFQLSDNLGPGFWSGNRMRFYSLLKDLNGLRKEAEDKNLNPILFPIPISPKASSGARAIVILSFGGGPNPNCKVLFTGGIHGRERIAVEMPYLIAEYLIKNYPDPKNLALPTANERVIKRLVDNCQIFVAPMLNPDGHTYATLDDRMWRKNRRQFSPDKDFTNQNGFISGLLGFIDYPARQYNAPPTITLDLLGRRVINFHTWSVNDGVDLNRNFPGPKWGHECYRKKTGARTTCGDPGASGQEADTYFGPCESSEPETQVIRQFFRDKGPFHASIDYHSYSRMILYPEEAKGDPNIERMAKWLQGLIGKEYGLFRISREMPQYIVVINQRSYWGRPSANSVRAIIESSRHSNPERRDY